jgi:hypothetical protein
MYIFSSLNTIKPDFNAIHPDYKKAIDYVDGNIPDLFREQKVKAYEFMLRIEKIHTHLLKFIQEVYPLESSYIAQSFNHYYSSDMKIPQIFDKDFYYKAKRYLEQINCLKNDGILENYLSIKNLIKDSINSYLSPNINKIDLNSLHIISLKYNKLDLSSFQINNEIVSNNNHFNDYYKYLNLDEGDISIAINPRFDVKNNSLKPNINEVCLIDIMENIYELKYFENSNET